MQRTYLEVACQANLLACPYEPLGRVVLIPLDGIAVVHGELVVEIVISFTNGNEGSDEVVARAVLVIERCFTEPVSERVNAERRLVQGQRCSRAK